MTFRYGPKAAAIGQRLEGSELPRVGVDHNGRLAAGAGRQEAHCLLCAVDGVVAAVLVAQERHDRGPQKLTPPIWCPQAWAAVEHQDELL